MKRKLFLTILFINLLFIPVYAKEDKFKVISGDINTVGSEICFGTECFYVIGNDGNNVKLFAKYNLLIGNSYDGTNAIPLENPTGIQDSKAIGWFSGYTADNPLIGTYPFYERDYWSSSTSNYPAYVYNEKSLIYPFVENYRKYLTENGVALSDARLISYEELLELGCSGTNLTCKNAPKWVWSTTYWTGSVTGSQYWVTFVYSHGGFFSNSAKHNFGVRPVIEVPVGYFNLEDNVYVGSINYVNSSENVVINNKKKFDLVFNDLEQETKYTTVIYNDTDQVLYVNNIDVDNLSYDFIDFRLDEKSENMMIEPRGSSLVTFYVKTIIKEGAGKNLDDEVTINFRVSDQMTNPKTLSNTIEFILLITILSLILFVIYKYSSKKIRLSLFIITFILCSTIIGFAKDELIVSVKGNIKYESLNILKTTGTIIKGGVVDYSNSKDVWTYYDDVKNIKISSLINEPKNYVKKFDLSSKGNNRVIGYLVKNDDENIPYDLLIQSHGAVIANKDSSFLFSFPNVESIDGLSNMDFSDTTSMKGMFNGNEELEEIDINNIDMDNVTDTSYMFYNCSNIDLSENDFNLDESVNTDFMFTTYLYNIVKRGAVSDKDHDYSKKISEVGDTSGKFYINDSIDDEYPIYYYRGIIDNNNVLFGNFCWKVVRTTNTGGIKMIYNGLPDDNGNCNKTGANASIGQAKFSNYSSSPSDLSYMYGTRYDYSKANASFDVLSRYYNANSNYYFGDSVTYSNGVYTLNNAKQYKWSSNYNNLVGYYTCSSTTSKSCNYVRYVVGSDSNYVYQFNLYSGKTIDDYFIKLGKTYQMNDNIATLTDVSVVKYMDWFKNYSNYKNYYICSNDLNSTTCSSEDFTKIIGTDSKSLSYLINSDYLYGNDVKYENGKYKLINTFKSINGYANDKSTIQSKYHYTCMSTSDTCDKVYYLVYFDKTYFYYLTLDGEKNIEEVNDKMYTNTNDSNIKSYIDNWYSKNLVSYTSWLEDTVWCNDKSYAYGALMSKDSNYSTNYFNADKRNTSLYKPDLTCNNINDSYTVDEANGNGKLTYPIGLLTSDEVTYAGSGWRNYSKDVYLYSGVSHWIMSPSYYGYDYARGFCVGDSGNLAIPAANFNEYVRPAISLKNNIMCISGDGTVNNPYIVKKMEN